MLEFFETMEKVRDPKENAIAQATFLLLTPPNQIFIILNEYISIIMYGSVMSVFGVNRNMKMQCRSMYLTIFQRHEQ